MDRKLFKAKMALYGDTDGSLAAAMGISRSAFYLKKYERGACGFTERELRFIHDRYKGVMTDEDFMQIFFSEEVS